MDTDRLLAEREKTHGEYEDDARAAMRLIDVVNEETAVSLTYVQRHTLHMICHKIARIITGDPNHLDHWVDLVGYPELVARSLKPRQEE